MNNRVLAALAFGSALLLAAYTASDFGSARAPISDSRTNVISAKAPVREYIPVDDANNDGVPDWQEILINTSSVNIGSSTTDPYEPPTTLTDQLAVTFFEGYVRNKGYGQFGKTPDELVSIANERLVNQTRDKIFTFEDISLSRNSSIDDLKHYGNTMALVILSLPKYENSRSEVEILESAIASDNENVLAELDPKIADYEKMKTEFLQVVVPSSLAKQHLDLVNSVNAVLEDIKTMKMAFNDPVLTLLRLQRYQDDTKGLYTSIINIQNKLKSQGVTYGPNDPAAQVIIIK